MNKTREFIKKFFHPFFILCMVPATIAGIFIIYNSRQAYATEEWVCEYLKSGNNNLSDLDIQVLARNLSAQIDRKMEEMSPDAELTKEQLRMLLAAVNEELQYASFSISQEELAGISSDTVKRTLSENLPEEACAAPHKAELDEAINSLEAQLLEIRTAAAGLGSSEKSISEGQIREIAEKAGLDEDTVKSWIREIHSSAIDSYDTAIEELAALLDTDGELLKKLLADAAQQEDAAAYLAARLEITQEQLKSVLGQAGSSGSRELLELAARLKSAEEELQNQISSDMSLITDSITSVQQQVIHNKSITDETIQENRQDALSAIEENRAEVDKQIINSKTIINETIRESSQTLLSLIEANKAETDEQINADRENTDAAIQKLQQNVLFYEYDEETNTLKLFESQ